MLAIAIADAVADDVTEEGSDGGRQPDRVELERAEADHGAYAEEDENARQNNTDNHQGLDPGHQENQQSGPGRIL